MPKEEKGMNELFIRGFLNLAVKLAFVGVFCCVLFVLHAALCHTDSEECGILEA